MTGTIRVSDSLAAMRVVLSAPLTERPARIRELYAPVAGLFRFMPGADPFRMHHEGFGFPVNRDADRCAEALRRLADADVWTRIERALTDGARALTAAVPGLQIPDIDAVLVLGDGSDDHFVDELGGLAATGGISGSILFTLWPTPQVLDRVGAVAVHELHHNVRYGPGGVGWNPLTVTVGEQIVAEGLADAFARELYGDAGYTHFARPHLHDDRVLQTVVDGLEVTGMANLMPWVLGDATARRMSAEPVGLPTGGGYAAGNRIADAYLAATGGTAAGAVRADSADVLDVALPALGVTARA